MLNPAGIIVTMFNLPPGPKPAAVAKAEHRFVAAAAAYDTAAANLRTLEAEIEVIARSPAGHLAELDQLDKTFKAAKIATDTLHGAVDRAGDNLLDVICGHATEWARMLTDDFTPTLGRLVEAARTAREAARLLAAYEIAGDWLGRIVKSPRHEARQFSDTTSTDWPTVPIRGAVYPVPLNEVFEAAADAGAFFTDRDDPATRLARRLHHHAPVCAFCGGPPSSADAAGPPPDFKTRCANCRRIHANRAFLAREQAHGRQLEANFL